MSSIPSTTASIYRGSKPSKLGHSLTESPDPKNDADNLRAMRLESFVNESPSAGNRIGHLTVKHSTEGPPARSNGSGDESAEQAQKGAGSATGKQSTGPSAKT